ncbi:hypothetical protein [Deinococcus ficus]|uniref:Uncharacterized protein n=1 Tax=Deinococcus ficus TaxID=317577 RepID=A0A221T373_9DEIO|nr:hypothetical protein [Deinococcus ficus]ASN83354.1 hypothetical protein DFI_19340 [Deinococcus ficus]
MKKILLALSLILTAALPAAGPAQAQTTVADPTVAPAYVPEDPLYPWTTYTYRKVMSRIEGPWYARYNRCNWEITRVYHRIDGTTTSDYGGMTGTQGASVAIGTPPPCPHPAGDGDY